MCDTGWEIKDVRDHVVPGIKLGYKEWAPWFCLESRVQLRHIKSSSLCGQTAGILAEMMAKKGRSDILHQLTAHVRIYRHVREAHVGERA
jgi:hypothetical protein